jgi:CBS domain-containing protein
MGSEEAAGEDIELQEIKKPAVSVNPDAPVREALKLMRENSVPGVPVVGEDGALEGFVTDGYLIASALPRYMRLMDNLSYVDRRFYRRKYDAIRR